MKIKCPNCRQTYESKHLPQTADRSICIYCGNPVGGLASITLKPQQKTTGKPKTGKLIQTLFFLAIFAGTIGYEYYKKFTHKNGNKGKSESPGLNAPSTGAYFKALEEKYYDAHDKYSEDFETLVKQSGKIKIDPAVTFGFSAVSQSGFTLYSTHPTYAKGKKIYYYHLPKLHRAARSGKQDQIKELLDSGEEINNLDQFGHTALYYAEKYGQKEAQTYLAMRGGKIK